jgi:hypothetical protein
METAKSALTMFRKEQAATFSTVATKLRRIFLV